MYFQKLSNMFIVLEHNLVPQHAIEKTAGTRALRKAEKEEFELYAVLKNGKYTKEEDTLIKKNWKLFCEVQ